MDSNEKDAAKLRRREEMLARRVGEALDRLDSRGADECPDAELIAAYSERALAPGESAQWESHFSACARCRTVLRVLAASGEAPLAETEITHLGEIVSGAGASAELKKEAPTPARERSTDWRIRWLAPAFGVAAALAVWFAVRPPWRSSNPGQKPVLVAQAPRTEPPQPPSSADQLTGGTPLSTREAGSASSGNAPSAKAQQKVLDFRPVANPLPASPPQKAKAADEMPALQSGVPPEAGSALKRLRPETSFAVAADKAVQEKKPSPPQREAGALSAPELTPQVAMNAGRNANITAAKSAQSAPITATSPYGSSVWRAGTGGQIEHSADTGESWMPQASPSHEDWLAGSAFSDVICWLAGRNGAIARTTNGEHWEIVTPPQQASGADGKMPDWVGVTVRGASAATVTARDGRRFATSDGGSSWQPQ